MGRMLLAELARTSAAVAAEPKRVGKIALLAACLRDAAADEIEVAVAYLSGDLRQRRTGIGWASLRDAPEPSQDSLLTIAEVDATFAEIAQLSGSGSHGSRRDLLTGLMRRATAPEQRFLTALISGELRQGASSAIVVDAVARASDLPVDAVRYAVMLRGEVGPVAVVALTEGAPGLAAFKLTVGRPLMPMLAQPSDSASTALNRLGGEASIEWKLDGVRVQLHRRGSQVRVFTRTLDDITERVPELVEAALELPVEAAVLDGEAIALLADGRPRRFQETASRIGSRAGVEQARRQIPLTLFVFDVLHVDGDDLLDRPARDRDKLLTGILPADLRVPRIVSSDATEAEAFLADCLARGHEGVVIKSLEARYAAGRRGAGWLKVKPVHTLDLVVLAAEWGHGRRRGWLSNLHLGALDLETGGFVMLGKTFKGLTDAMLEEQTARLLELEASRNDWQVTVRPEFVVEVAFDGVQTSSRYPGGVALRFARVVRFRPDKHPTDADTIGSVRAIHARADGAPPATSDSR